jgi:hypothetical protein
MSRIPALARPIAIGASTITIDYDGATTEVISVTAATRYNDLSGDAASDLWAYVLAAINAGSAFTWVAETVANRPYGRRRLAVNGAPDFVVSVTFSSSALSTALGFSSTTPAVVVSGSVSFTSRVTALWTPQGYWTPHSELVTALVRDPWRYEDAALVTESPTGGATVDDYGGVALRRVDMVRLYAANALECYRLDGDFAVGQGDLLTTDPHYSWEAFRRGWLQGGGSARYYPDRAAPATYNTVQPRAPWIASSSQGLSEFRTNPLTFNLSIEMVQTS